MSEGAQDPIGASLDEALGADGRPNAEHAEVLAAIARRGPGALAAELAAAARDSALLHGKGEAEHVFHVDPVPRVLARAEWERLADGLEQRVRALEALAADAHGPREAVRAGVLPADVLDTSRYASPGLATPRVWIGVAGPDVVRDGHGELVVLEDNVRTPTMLLYAIALRDLVAGRLRVEAEPAPIREPAREALWRVLRTVSPREDPVVAVLGDGPESAVPWEIDAAGELLGVPVLQPAELRAAHGEVRGPDGRRIDVLWRRTGEERLRDDAGRSTVLGDVLGDALRAGTLAVVNAFGSGVADDKRVLPYAEDLVRFYCGEAPRLRSARSYDLGNPEHRAEAFARLGELVLKPRSGSGGFGVLIGPRATGEQLAAARAAVEAEPGEWIAQEPVALSTHPTVVDGALAARHVDLRPFAFGDGERITVLPGGFTRVALPEGELVVNASQGGGGKDTWVL